MPDILKEPKKIKPAKFDDFVKKVIEPFMALHIEDPNISMEDDDLFGDIKSALELKFGEPVEFSPDQEKKLREKISGWIEQAKALELQKQVEKHKKELDQLLEEIRKMDDTKIDEINDRLDKKLEEIEALTDPTMKDELTKLFEALEAEFMQIGKNLDDLREQAEREKIEADARAKEERERVDAEAKVKEEQEKEAAVKSAALARERAEEDAAREARGRGFHVRDRRARDTRHVATAPSVPAEATPREPSAPESPAPAPVAPAETPRTAESTPAPASSTPRETGAPAEAPTSTRTPVGERARSFDEIRKVEDLKNKLDEVKKKLMEAAGRKEKNSGFLGKLTGKKAKSEAEYNALQAEFDRLNSELKAESRVEGKKTLEFLEEQEKRSHETLRDQYKIKESSLVKGWRWLGDMNMFNLMKSQAEKKPEGFWAKELKKIESLPKWRQKMNQIGGNVFSLRTSITTGLAGFGFLGGAFQAAAESATYIGIRTGAIGLGATLGDLDALGRAHMKKMGKEGNVFETKEEAKKAKAEKATVLEDIDDPKERLSIVSQKIHEYRGFAMAHDIDLEKDDTIYHLLEMRRKELEKVPKEKGEEMLALLEKMEQESFTAITKQLTKEKKDRWKRVCRSILFGGISAATFFAQKMGEFNRVFGQAFEEALGVQDKGHLYAGGVGVAAMEAKTAVVGAGTGAGAAAETLPEAKPVAPSPSVVEQMSEHVEATKPSLAATYEIHGGKGFLHGMNSFQRDPILHDKIVVGVRASHPEWADKSDDFVVHKWRVEQAHGNGFLYGQRGVSGEFHTKTLHDGAKINLAFNEKGYPEVSVGKEHVTEHGLRYHPGADETVKMAGDVRDVVPDEKDVVSGVSKLKTDEVLGVKHDAPVGQEPIIEAKAPSVVEDHGIKFGEQYDASEKEAILKDIELRKEVIEAGHEHLAELQKEFGNRPEWNAFADAYNQRLDGSQTDLDKMIDQLDDPGVEIKPTIVAYGGMTPEQFGHETVEAWEGIVNQKTHLISTTEAHGRLTAELDQEMDEAEFSAGDVGEPVGVKVETGGGAQAVHDAGGAGVEAIHAETRIDPDWSNRNAEQLGDPQLLKGTTADGHQTYVQPYKMEDSGKWMNVMFDDTGKKMGYIDEFDKGHLGEPQGGWPKGVPEKMEVPGGAKAHEAVADTSTGPAVENKIEEVGGGSVEVNDGVKRIRTDEAAVIDVYKTPNGEIKVGTIQGGDAPMPDKLFKEFFPKGNPERLAAQSGTYQDLRAIYAYHKAYDVIVDAQGSGSEEAKALLGQMQSKIKMLDGQTPDKIKDFLDPRFAETLGYDVEVPDTQSFDSLFVEPDTKGAITWLSRASHGELSGIDSSEQIEAIKLKDQLDSALDNKDAGALEKVLKKIEEFRKDAE